MNWIVWMENNPGLVLTVGGSIVVAIIGGVFGLWAKNHTPKTPVPIQDVWGENRALRGDLRAVEASIEELREEYHDVKEAFGGLWSYMGRVRDAWGRQPEMPRLTVMEKRKLATVVEESELADW
jgi:hypothetical protein